MGSQRRVKPGERCLPNNGIKGVSDDPACLPAGPREPSADCGSSTPCPLSSALIPSFSLSSESEHIVSRLTWEIMLPEA